MLEQPTAREEYALHGESDLDWTFLIVAIAPENLLNYMRFMCAFYSNVRMHALREGMAYGT